MVRETPYKNIAGVLKPIRERGHASKNFPQAFSLGYRESRGRRKSSRWSWIILFLRGIRRSRHHTNRKEPHGVLFSQDLVSSLCPPFPVTIPTKKLIKTFWIGLKRKLGYVSAATAALPLTFVHLPLKAATMFVICHFAFYLMDLSP